MMMMNEYHTSCVIDYPPTYIIERRAYKKLVTEYGLCNNTSVTHNAYFAKQITRKFKTD
jgi:hypothetical protein